MTKNKEPWIQSAWTISIGTAIFSLLLTMGYDYSKEKPILTTLFGFSEWIGNFIWGILNFELKVWWIIVVIIVLIMRLFLISKFNKKGDYLPDYFSYKEDKFKKWKWSWDWKFSSRKKAWVISDLKAHCPKCDTPMIDYSSTYASSFECPRCEYQAHEAQCEDPDKIEMIIHDNIDRKESE